MKDATQKKIEQILTPGSLRAKHEQISLFMAGGYSMLYSGDVDWKLSLPEEDKILKGNAESLDEAFSQIKGIIEEILKNTNPATKVALVIKEKQE
jgi:hypothetical protein